MACRVGITTDPDERRQHWESIYPDLRNWTIVGTFGTKSAAQDLETRHARQHGCDSHPGGAGPEHGNWSVYHFEF